MKTEPLGFLPRARQEGMISKEVEGELLIYDGARDRAHCLNPLAGAIWKLCDGRRTVAEIARKLSIGLIVSEASATQKTADEEASGGLPRHIDERVVWLGLAELRNSHLLEEPNERSHWPSSLLGVSGMSRREAIRRIGLGAAITLPIVVSMTVPTAVQAAVSCKGRCQPCTTGECCSGVCAGSGVTGCPGSGNKCN